jgi:WD40 repeat protein
MPTSIAEYQVAGSEIAFAPKLDAFATVRPVEASGLDDSRIFLWDAKTGELLGEDSFPGVSHWDRVQPQFTPDGQRLILELKSLALVWPIESRLRTKHRFEGRVEVVGGGRWAIVPQESRDELWDLTTLTNRGELPGSKGWGSSGFSADGRWAAREYSRRAGESRRPLETWLPDRWNPFRSRTQIGSYDTGLWDLSSMRRLYTYEGCYDDLFSPDGKAVALRHADHTIQVWDVPPFYLPLWLTALLSLAIWGQLISAAHALRARLARRASTLDQRPSGTPPCEPASSASPP